MCPVRPAIYLCGLTVQAPPAHRPPSLGGELRRAAALAGPVRATGQVHPQHHRHRRQGPGQGDRGRACRSGRWRTRTSGSSPSTTRGSGVLPPTYEPRATGHVPEMHELIEKLIADGHAYPATDGSGDVYFDVGTFAGVRPAVRAASRTPCRPRRTDRPGRSATRATSRSGRARRATSRSTRSGPRRGAAAGPAGTSSARRCAGATSGAEFDIHGGGLDLVFPHHENEIAQSQAAGLPFARFWVHHGLLNLDGSKMAKSTGQRHRPADDRGAWGSARWSCATTWPPPHYRSVIDYTEDSLREAAPAYQRLEGFVQRAERGRRRSKPGHAAGGVRRRRWTTT